MDIKKLPLLLVLVFFISGCSKRVCDETIVQPYDYPNEASGGKTFEERIEMLKIPQQSLQCMSTRALVESCLNYPQFSLIWTRNDLQKGFDDVEKWCNGFGVLWGRKGKFRELLSIYNQKNFSREWDHFTALENGEYMDDIVRVELVLSQYEILNSLSVTEKKELFQLVLGNQKKKAEMAQYWGGMGMQTSCAILARIMFKDKYPEFVAAYKNNADLAMTVNDVSSRDWNVINIVTDISEDYLIMLKRKP